MKRSLILVIVFLSLAVTVYSKNNKPIKPNYKKIEKAISKSSSTLYYPKLFDRFISSDTTLTANELVHIYYGYTFQDSYSPYASSDYSDSVNLVLKQEEITEDDWRKVITLCDSILADNPFDLRAMNKQLYAYEDLKMMAEFTKRRDQMSMIINTLENSGDGLSKKTAYHVISIAHEYDLLNILGYEFGGQQSLIEHYDYLKLSENDQQISGLYFDVSPCLKSLSSMFK